MNRKRNGQGRRPPPRKEDRPAHREAEYDSQDPSMLDQDDGLLDDDNFIREDADKH